MADLSTLLSKFLTNIYAGTARYVPLTFATLPSSPAEGTVAAITDSNTATWGATAAGGGANHVLLYFNGTNWTVQAK